MIAETPAEIGKRGATGGHDDTHGDRTRVKVQGRWLCLAPDTSLDDVLATALQAISEQLVEWFIAPGQYLAGAASRRTGPRGVSTGALDILLRELVQLGRLGGLPLMSRAYQPYLAYFRLEDEGEIDCQIAALRAFIAGHDHVTWRELPAPGRSVGQEAWRMLVVAHGEWLGLGHQPERGTLVAW